MAWHSIREPRFNSETLGEQTRKLNDFCKGPCGKSFNDLVSEEGRGGAGDMRACVWVGWMVGVCLSSAMQRRRLPTT